MTAPRAGSTTRTAPRLLILSDLHLETGRRRFDDYFVPDCDVVVAAGDIHANAGKAVAWLATLGKPVVYVLGNHEFWGQCEPLGDPPLPDFAETVAQVREMARGTDVHVLDNDVIMLAGVRFLGTTLWADFGGGRLYQAARSRYGWRLRNYEFIGAASFYRDPANASIVAAIRREAPDSFERLALHPRIAHALHNRAVASICKSLKEPFEGPTVVVTHNAPHYDSLTRAGIEPRFIDHRQWVEPEPDAPLHRVAEYASDLSWLLQRNASTINMWVHGHIHTALDYVVEGVRVVCNPGGYSYSPTFGFRRDKVVVLDLQESGER